MHVKDPSPALQGYSFYITFYGVQGKLEVDLVLGDHEVAIEIKATQNANPRHAKGLKSFAEEYSVKKLLLIPINM